MEAWQATVQDEAGNVVFNPQITVYESDGVTLASIYNEDGSPKENPFTGTLEGFAQFWAEPGVYKVRGANGGLTELWEVDLGSAKLPPYVAFNSRAQAEAASIPSSVQYINVAGLQYALDPTGTALTTADGKKWSPRIGSDGFVSLRHWGVVYGDRASAASNGVAINDALDWCASNGAGLDLGAGIIFNSVPIVQSGRVHVRGAGAGYWQKQYANDFPPQAETAIVMVGTGPKTETLFGVSSCYAWGAARANPSARAGYNDSEYRLTSFVTESASAAGRSLKQFSCAWKVTDQAAWGSSWHSFRIMPDAGGFDGMADVRSSDRSVTKPLSAGDWDVGFMLRRQREVSGSHFQVVGQWRMHGLLIAPHAKQSELGAASYNTSFDKSTFCRVSIRSVDTAPIVATTASTVDIPWADDHPFGADGDLSVILTTGGRAGVTHTFTGMQRDDSGAFPVLRLTGVSPSPTAQTYKNCMPAYKGGGSSHNYFADCEFQGFGHGSLQPSEIADLGGSSPFQHPLAIIEISGNELTEIGFGNSAVTGYETVAVHMHDCRNVTLPRYWEMNIGGRIIGSPARSANIHAVGGVAATETMETVFEPEGSTIDNGSLDMRPYVREMAAPPLFSADNGFFEGVRTQSSRFSHLSYLDLGSAVIAPTGGRAGIGRMTGRTDFFNPNVNQIDYALYYDDVTDRTRVRKDIMSNTPGQASIGTNGGEFREVRAHRFNSKTILIADDAVASFTPEISGGFMLVTTYLTNNLPLTAHSGLIFFDCGTSLASFKAELGAGGLGLIATTGPLSGTTGSDGVLTVSANTGALLFENRTGNQVTVRIAILC